MSDIIKLLPDSVANQIAAGEVIQRPSSVVKELLDNAVDAGSTDIRLIIKDGGRSLIQVIDNGKGMSVTDARMCWERHATSKISRAEDIYAIRTMGFRGEALASIASVARVEMKTRVAGQELGTLIEIEGSEVKKQSTISSSPGTSISVKNLFYNIPARRNFLKSNPVETKHIIDEFTRIALAYPAVKFSMFNNDSEVWDLAAGNLKKRISDLFGYSSSEEILELDETTSILEIGGYTGTPVSFKRTRGEQYFFVNNRYIRDPYLNHAVVSAYENLIPKEAYPFYVITLKIDPSAIDVNVHPTKTEIKFEDEKAVYLILKSVLKKALGKYNLTPEFGSAGSFEFSSGNTFAQTDVAPVMPQIKRNPDYNPFIQEKQYQRPSIQKGWEQIYATPASQKIDSSGQEKTIETESTGQCFQIQNRYIISQIKSGMMIIDQQAAHERILFEKYLDALEQNIAASQQQLFPKVIEFNSADFILVEEIIHEIRSMGFDISVFGRNSIVLNGIPADVKATDEKDLIEGFIEKYKANAGAGKLSRKENLARSLAEKAAVKPGTSLGNQEMIRIIDELFACANPYYAPNGNPTIVKFAIDELQKLFERSRNNQFSIDR